MCDKLVKDLNYQLKFFNKDIKELILINSKKINDLKGFFNQENIDLKELTIDTKLNSNDFFDKILKINQNINDISSAIELNKLIAKFEKIKQRFKNNKKICHLISLYLKYSKFFYIAYYCIHDIENQLFDKFTQDIYRRKLNINHIYDYTRCFTNVQNLKLLLYGDILSESNVINYNGSTNFGNLIQKIISDEIDLYTIIGSLCNNSSKMFEGPDHIYLIFKFLAKNGCPSYGLIQSYYYQYCPRVIMYNKIQIIEALKTINNIFYDENGSIRATSSDKYTKEDNIIYNKYFGQNLFTEGGYDIPKIFIWLNARTIMNIINGFISAIYKDKNNLPNLDIFQQKQITSGLTLRILNGIRIRGIKYMSKLEKIALMYEIIEKFIEKDKVKNPFKIYSLSKYYDQIQNIIMDITQNNGYDNQNTYKYRPIFKNKCYNNLANILEQVRDIILPHCYVIRGLLIKYNNDPKKVFREIKSNSQLAPTKLFVDNLAIQSLDGLLYFSTIESVKDSFYNTYLKIYNVTANQCIGPKCSYAMTGGEYLNDNIKHKYLKYKYKYLKLNHQMSQIK